MTSDHGQVLLGYQEPRLSTALAEEPESLLPQLEAFAKLLGEELMPWQKLVLQDATQLNESGKFVKRQVGLLLPRQQGKTFTARLRVLFGLFELGETWISMAQNRRLALDQLNAGANLAKAVPELANRIVQHRQSNGDETLVVSGPKGQGVWRIAAATQEGPRGLTGNLWIDELREISEASFAAATPVTRVVPNSQIWLTSNAGDSMSTVLNDFRSRALTSTNPAVGYYEWSAHEDLDPMDPEAWKQSNPALGYRMEAEAIEQAAMMETYEAFMTETLCRWVSAIHGAFPGKSLQACIDQDAYLVPNIPTFFGFDRTPDRRRADLVAVQVQDGKIVVRLMESWSSDSALDSLKVADHVAGITDRWQTQGVAFDAFASNDIGERLKFAKRAAVDISYKDFAQGCDETLSLMVAQELRIGSEETLFEHFTACVRKPVQDGGWKVVRRGSDKHISAAVASILAIHLASKPARSADIVFV